MLEALEALYNSVIGTTLQKLRCLVTLPRHFGAESGRFFAAVDSFPERNFRMFLACNLSHFNVSALWFTVQVTPFFFFENFRSPC